MNPQSSDSGTTANLPAITQLRYWDRHSWEKEIDYVLLHPHAHVIADRLLVAL